MHKNLPSVIINIPMMAITFFRNEKQLQRGTRAVVWWLPHNQLQDNKFYVDNVCYQRVVAVILDAGF